MWEIEYDDLTVQGNDRYTCGVTAHNTANNDAPGLIMAAQYSYSLEYDSYANKSMALFKETLCDQTPFYQPPRASNSPPSG